MPRVKGPQVQQAYDYIKDKILSFDFPPGSAISDNILAQELDMSRSPIREAILKLISDGLIETKNRRTQVTPLSIVDIIEICQVREAVEISAVNIIMDNNGLNKEYKEKLTTIYNEMNNSSELIKTYFYDDQFHGTIMNAAGNSRLIEIYNRMRLQISRARWLNIIIPDRKLIAAKEHEAIYNALINDDREASIASLRQHLENSAANFRMILNNPQYNPQFNIAMASLSSSSFRAAPKNG